MLTMSMKTWSAATVAALLALTGGIAASVSGESPRPADQSASAFLAQGGADCDEEIDRNCDVWDTEPPASSEPPGDDGGSDSEGGGDGRCYWTQAPISVADETGQEMQLVLAAQTRIEIPCNHPEYGFLSGGCYYGDPPPLVQPPASPPDGQTAEDGAYYFERCIGSVEVFNGELFFTFPAVISWQWFENGAVPVVLPTPEEVAEAWLASVTLDPVEIQLAPPDTGVGVVNLPVWMGVTPTDNSWGTIDDFDCDATGTVCVTIEALVMDVEWDMGDGATVTCGRDQHEPWTRAMEYLSPGDHCHHYYERASRNQPDGKYQITATSNWEVRWVAEASGVSGVIPTTQVAETSLQINEIQVLTR